jgi:hypothetical protein
MTELPEPTCETLDQRWAEVAAILAPVGNRGQRQIWLREFTDCLSEVQQGERSKR